MDDIRRPHQPQRRDYTTPPQRPHHSPAPHHHAPQPAHQDFAPAPSQPAAEPHIYHRPAESTPPSRPEPVPAHAHEHQAAHQAALPRRSRHRGLKITALVIAPFIIAGIFAAGYSLKSSKDTNTIPASIVKQANFDLFFPSPMPPGYLYMKDTATFQIGQVFYKFSNNRKRVTVNEQPMPATKPNFSLLNGYEQFSSPVGQAAVGSTLGESTAYVLAGGTLITMNTSGGVSKDELKTAINNLKNIGQNPQKNG